MKAWTSFGNSMKLKSQASKHCLKVYFSLSQTLISEIRVGEHGTKNPIMPQNTYAKCFHGRNSLKSICTQPEFWPVPDDLHPCIQNTYAQTHTIFLSFTNTHTRTHIHTHTCTHTYIHTHSHEHIQTFLNNTCNYTHIHMYTHTNVRTHTHRVPIHQHQTL